MKAKGRKAEENDHQRIENVPCVQRVLRKGNPLGDLPADFRVPIVTHVPENRSMEVMR
jgi:hypothetical protein